MWNMKVIVIQVVYQSTKKQSLNNLVKEVKKLEISERFKTIQVTAVLKTVRILTSSALTCCHLVYCESHQLLFV